MTTCGHRAFLAVALAATIGTVLAACSPSRPSGPARGPAGDAAAGTSAATQPAEGATPAWPASKVATDTYVSAGGYDPVSLDPAQVYETGGESIDMSLYDGLVAFEREKPDAFVPALATSWEASPDGLTYTFQMRKGVAFHAGGTLEAHDAAYSIQRVMLRDASGGPSWMFLQPLLGVTTIKDRVVAEANLEIPAGGEAPAMDQLPEEAKLAACQAALDAVVADDDAGTVTIRLRAPTPWFLQLLATWLGSVLDREWMAEQGDWDGTCATWTRFYDIATEDSVLYDRANGTGPYRLSSWKKKESITLEGNEDYWRTEPAWEGGPFGPPRLKHVVLQHVPEWGARFTKLQSGEADNVGIESSVIDQVAPYVGLEYLAADDNAEATVLRDDGILKLYHGYPTVVGGAIHMVFEVATEGGNEFIGSGRLDGEGVPPDFFSDIHVRKGFNYCFDMDTYLRDVVHGDGIRMRGPIIQGLQGYRADSPLYAFDLELCKQEFALAWDGKLAETGFHMTVPYAEGWTDAQAAYDLLADGLGQVDPKYKLEPVQMEWPTMLDNLNRHRLPMIFVGWIEDYHDASNWVQAYMTAGGQAGTVGWPADLSERVNTLVGQGLTETDPASRDAIYAELQQISHDEALAIYGYQALGRFYVRREVKGWYDNALAPNDVYYAMWKAEP